MLSYRDPDEKRLASIWLQEARTGYFRNGFGAAQHFLLPALDASRRSVEVVGRIGVLERKFSQYPRGFFIRPRSRGGFIRSPVKHDAVNRISDRQWLRLICNRQIPPRDGRWTQRANRRAELAESSVEIFARDFGLAAKRQPARFAKLALRIPPGAPPDYLSAAFGGLQYVEPPSDMPEEERSTWRPASREDVEGLLATAPLHDDANSARSLCWLLTKRTDVRPSERIIEHLIHLTGHLHPLADELVVGCDKSASEVGTHSLEENAINCVRSLAAITIASVLDGHPELFEKFRPALVRLLHDPNPVVRIAMVEVCLPVWTIDKSTAMQWFLELTTNDLRLACGRHAEHFCNQAFPAFTVQLTPLIAAMIESPVMDIAEEGAMEATARRVFFDVLNDLAAKCVSGTEPQRKGVARIVAHFVVNEDYSRKCQALMVQLGDDESEDVREEVGKALQNVRLFGVPDSVLFLTSFSSTRAFRENPGALLLRLEQHTGSLTALSTLVFSAVDGSIQALTHPTDKPRSRSPLMDQHVVTVLLRLYEQADGVDAEIRNKCLDLIDRLLEKRIAPARTLIDAVDR